MLARGAGGSDEVGIALLRNQTYVAENRCITVAVWVRIAAIGMVLILDFGARIGLGFRGEAQFGRQFSGKGVPG